MLHWTYGNRVIITRNSFGVWLDHVGIQLKHLKSIRLLRHRTLYKTAQFVAKTPTALLTTEAFPAARLPSSAADANRRRRTLHFSLALDRQANHALTFNVSQAEFWLSGNVFELSYSHCWRRRRRQRQPQRIVVVVIIIGTMWRRLNVHTNTNTLTHRYVHTHTHTRYPLVLSRRCVYTHACTHARVPAHTPNRNPQQVVADVSDAAVVVVVGRRPSSNSTSTLLRLYAGILCVFICCALVSVVTI